jgi:hypothetical protein
MRVAIALGVMPCSTSVTAMALKSFDSFAFGVRPVSIEERHVAQVQVAEDLVGRSLPRTTILSGVDQASSDLIGFCFRAISPP